MKIATITTFNNNILKSYAYKFINSYNWQFPLYVYSEDTLDNKAGIDKVYSTFDKIPQCKEFIERNKKRPIPRNAWGLLRGGRPTSHDSISFSYKVYSYTDWILNESNGYDGVICIDADSVFYKKCNSDWIREHIHRDNSMMTYLGRGKQIIGDSLYSECGYLYFNLKHPKTKEYAQAMQDMYNKDTLFNLKEWHDSYIWDNVRIKFEKEFKINNHNIGDNGGGHVQARSVVGQLYDRCKGNRKKTGFSQENTLYDGLHR